MKPAITLTEAHARHARHRGPGETVLRDAIVPGLSLRLREGGSRTWVLRRAVDGRQHRIRLGSADTMTVDAARDAARAVIAGHPRAGIRQPAAQTFAAFAGRYRARMAMTWKPSTIAKSDLAFDTRLIPAFGRTPINQLDPHEVARWFHEISRDTPGRANRLLDELRAMLKRARAWGAIDAAAPDPTALVTRNPRQPRWRLLSLEELGRLGAALDRLARDLPDETDAIRLILLTGCRSGEVLRLPWSAVKADRLALCDSKTGPRTVLLSEPASALLEARRPHRVSGWVFPAVRDKRRPRSDINAAWRRVKAEAGLRPSIRLHDLRHTYASRAVMDGETLQMTGRLLGHKGPRSTERYAHLEEGFLAAAADRISSRIASLMAGGSSLS
ncbi:MAG: tyrosine-type recombinase/integrase [Pseudomonadota bacterium]